ncbi:hypothetical protein HA402_003883 [Bradysia odoriphaga]|nr:hypothetical protein HA402_003883 [Bradysia odoriphaga]
MATKAMPTVICLLFQNKSCVDFVDLSVPAVRNNLVTSALPITLLGDMFDAVTLDESEKLFRYVEDNVEMLRSADQDDKNTHKTAIATPEQLKELSVIIGGTWKKLGSKLANSGEPAVPKRGPAYLVVDGIVTERIAKVRLDDALRNPRL